MALDVGSRRELKDIEDDWQEVDDAGSVHSIASSISDGEIVELNAYDGNNPKDSPNESSKNVQTDNHGDDDGNNGISDQECEEPNQLDARPGQQSFTTELPNHPKPAANADDTKNEANKSPTPVRRISISALIHEREADKAPSSPQSPPVRKHDDEGSPRSSAADSFATQNDVVCFSNRLLQLQRNIHDTVREISDCQERNIGFRIPVIYKIHDTVRMLSEQMDELCPIVKTCAEYLTKHNRVQWMNPSDLPLNANLPQWLDELRTSMLGFQSQVDSQVHSCYPGGRLSPTPISPISGFSKSSDNLERLRLAMTEFLPLIKADYCEFRTKHMSMPTSPEPVAGRRRSGGVDPTIAALRSAFYKMRDEIKKVLDLIVSIHSSDLTSDIAKDAPAAIKSLSNLRDAIMLILTNNPTEWIESDLNDKRRILSYPAFIALSPEVLHDVTCSLEQVREDLDVTVDESTPEKMIYRHQIVLLTEGGQLKEIQSTASFLESLLIPGSEDGL